jgi:hypothetical protein
MDGKLCTIERTKDCSATKFQQQIKDIIVDSIGENWGGSSYYGKRSLTNVLSDTKCIAS